MLDCRYRTVERVSRVTGCSLALKLALDPLNPNAGPRCRIRRPGGNAFDGRSTATSLFIPREVHLCSRKCPVPVHCFCRNGKRKSLGSLPRATRLHPTRNFRCKFEGRALELHEPHLPLFQGGVSAASAACPLAQIPPPPSQSSFAAIRR